MNEFKEIFFPIIECLAFFQEQFIYHGNITMDNIVMDEDTSKGGPLWKICDWNESKKALLMMNPNEARWGKDKDGNDVTRVDQTSD